MLETQRSEIPTDRSAPRLMIFGAHPDDVELTAAGLSMATSASGGVVVHVNVTDGGSGHPTIPASTLRVIRRREADEAAAICGATAEHLNFGDGTLEPDVTTRQSIIKIIRFFRPDVIVSPRDVDYHPDHRALGQLVQDSCLLAAEEGLLPDTPALATVPILLYVSDQFTRPVPHRPDLTVDLSATIERKIEAVLKHRSQFFDWLTWSEATSDPEPANHDELVAEVRDELRARFENHETFEISEYGSPASSVDLQRLLALNGLV